MALSSKHVVELATDGGEWTQPADPLGGYRQQVIFADVAATEIDLKTKLVRAV